MVGKPLFKGNFFKVSGKKTHIHIYIINGPNTKVNRKKKILNKRNIHMVINASVKV